MKFIKKTLWLKITLWLLAIHLGSLIPISTHHRYMCSITGSHKFQRTFFFGLYSDVRYKKSPMENWIEDYQADFKCDWEYYGTATYSLSGTGRLCGRPPAMHMFSYGIQKWFLKYATQKEIVNFIELLQRTEAEKRKEIVEEAVDRALELGK